LPLEKIVARQSACRYRRVGARGVEIPGFAAEPNVDAREGAWRQAIPHVHDPQRHRLDHGEAEPCHRRARVGLAQSFDTRERLKVVDMGSSTKKMRQVLSFPEMFAAAAPVCPKCTKPMTPRSATRPGGDRHMFWGCMAFPKCLGTRTLR